MNKSKYQRLSDYILKGNLVSAKTAWSKFGVYRAAVVVNRLRKRGHKIVTDMSLGYARYSLK